MPSPKNPLAGFGAGRRAPVTDLDLESENDRIEYRRRVGVEFSAAKHADLIALIVRMGHEQPGKLRSRASAIEWIAEKRMGIFRRAGVLPTRRAA